MYHRSPYTRTEYKKTKFSSLLPVIVTIIALLIFLTLFVIRSGFFSIKAVIIEGRDAVINRQIKQYLAKNVHFTFTPVKNKEDDVKRLSLKIDTVSLETAFLAKTLSATYSLRNPHYLWCAYFLPLAIDESKNPPAGGERDCYIVDANGILFRKPIKEDTPLTVRVEDTYFINLAVGKKIPSPYILMLFLIENALKEKNIKTDRFIIENPFTIKAFPQNNPELRFTSLEPIEPQIQNFLAFSGSLPEEKFSQITYIDLRIKNKVYYK